MVKRRTVGGIAILLAWGGGLAVLVQHEYFRPRLERLAEAATRVAPATMYYAAILGDKQVGFASSTIDTANTAVTENDYFVAELQTGARIRRETARTNVTLSRALHLSRFDLTLDDDGAGVEMTGRVDGDSVLVVDEPKPAKAPKPDPARVALREPILLPTLVPLVVALSERPSVGKRLVLPVFDPTTRAPRSIGYTIRAESLFVLSDSATLDTAVTPPVWRGVHPDTVRAWEIRPDSGVEIGFAGWVDEQGRIVATSQLGLQLRRVPYELAFRNWQNDPTAHASDAGHVVGTTALAAGKVPHGRITSMVARVQNIDPKLKFRLSGAGQRTDGDTVFVTAAADTALAPMEPTAPMMRNALATEAANIVGSNTTGATMIRRLSTWVHDSIRPRVSFGDINAIHIVQSRSGDCNEFAQVFVALARARGVMARTVSGLLYVDGKFYYHAWAEVLAKDYWVAVDPMLNQVPADAAHIRLTPGLSLRTELIRRWTGLDVDVISVSEAPRKPSEMSHR